MELKGLVGPQSMGDGQEGLIRLGNSGDVIANMHGEFAEAVLRGKCFYAATAATGVAHGTVIGTTGPFTLFNPLASNVNAVVWVAAMGYVSGTLGAGVIHWVANTNPAAAAVTGTTIVTVNALIGGATGKVQAFTTSTLPASPTLFRVFGSIGPILATSAERPWVLKDDVNGAFVVQPGCSVSLEATATAGTAPLVVYTCAWEEVPVR